MNNFRYIVAIAATALFVTPCFAGEIPAPPFETAVEHSSTARDTQNGPVDNKKLRRPTDPESRAAAPGHLTDSQEIADPTASDRVRKWTRTRWNAARKSWSNKNAKFYACSAEWRKSNSGRKYAFHDQREFIFRCMNDNQG